MKRILLIGLPVAVVVALLVVLLMRRGPSVPEPPLAPLDDGGLRFFGLSEWLDSCLNSCRPNVRRRLSHLSPEKQRQFCDVNCECGLEKMTEPGPKPGQVQAPSVAWRRLSEDQQMQAAQDCQKRSSDSVGGVQPPGAPGAP
jgi:hypothetical protein